MTRRNRPGRRTRLIKTSINLIHFQLVLVCAYLLVQGEGGADEGVDKTVRDLNVEGSEAAALADLRAKFEHLSNKLEGLTVSSLSIFESINM